MLNGTKPSHGAECDPVAKQLLALFIAELGAVPQATLSTVGEQILGGLFREALTRLEVLQ